MTSMSVNRNVRVLVAGDVCGRVAQLCRKVTALDKKTGPFDLLLCVGQFTPPATDTETETDTATAKQWWSTLPHLPVATYILSSADDVRAAAEYFPGDGSSCELAPNLTYLGQKGILTTAHGLTVAYLSGTLPAPVHPSTNRLNQPPELGQFDDTQVEEVVQLATCSSDFRGVDVLLTGAWPSDVQKYAPKGNHRVLQETALHCSRFIALAPVNNEKKERWLYAFNITPMKYLNRAELCAQPPDAGEFPYAAAVQRATENRTARYTPAAAAENSDSQGKKGAGKQFFFDMESGPDKEDRRKGGQKRRMWEDPDAPTKTPKHQIDPQSCWFCLSNPKVEKQLIVNIGELCYLAMPKGPLNDGHVMILSISHVQSWLDADEATRIEVEKYKSALAKAAASQKCGLVTFERNYRTQHMQINCVMVPDSIDGKAFEEALQAEAEISQLELIDLPPDATLNEIMTSGAPYFHMTLPNGSSYLIRQMRGFPLHFGRSALCNVRVLNEPDKVDWKLCDVDVTQMQRLVDGMRQVFKPFEFVKDDSDGDDG